MIPGRTTDSSFDGNFLVVNYGAVAPDRNYNLANAPVFNSSVYLFRSRGAWERQQRGLTHIAISPEAELPRCP